MVITFANFGGVLTSETKAKPYTRLRIAEPKDGAKYKTTFGERSACFINGLLAYKHLDWQNQKRLYITEGEKKAFVACRQGVPTIGVSGIYNIAKKEKDAAGEVLSLSSVRLLDDVIKRMPNLQDIVFLYDQDCRQGTQSRKANFVGSVITFAEHFAQSLPDATTWFAHINDESDWEAKGVDDLYLHFKKEAAKLTQDLLELKSGQYFKFVKVGKHDKRKLHRYFKHNPKSAKLNGLNKKDIGDAYYSGQFGDGMLLAQLCEGNYLYNATRKKWMAFRSGRWDAGDKYQLNPVGIVSKNLPEIYTSNISPDGEDAEKALVKRVKSLQTWGYAVNVTNYAQARVVVQADEMDRNPYLLNLQNGVYDLQKDQFRQHLATDRMALQAGVEFDSYAKEPYFFITFLEEVFEGDLELVAFTQKWLGLCLSGSVDWQAFVYAYGSGKNGKSKFFEFVRLLLGSYFVTIPSDLLINRGANSTDEYQRARFLGARLVLASELPKDRFMNESQVKDLTGGDQINARYIFGEPFSFSPSHKLAMFGNHKLVVKGQDNGIWRRIGLLPFTADFTHTAKNGDGMTKDFLAELPGVLNWCLDGYKRFLAEGLEKPSAMVRAVEEYKKESDVLGEFINDRLGKSLIGASVTLAEVYKEYVKHCQDSQEDPTIRNARHMASNLRERGFAVERGAGNKSVVLHTELITEFETKDNAPF